LAVGLADEDGETVIGGPVAVAKVAVQVGRDALWVLAARWEEDVEDLVFVKGGGVNADGGVDVAEAAGADPVALGCSNSASGRAARARVRCGFGGHGGWWSVRACVRVCVCVLN
jgi:hypothetical protein